MQRKRSTPPLYENAEEFDKAMSEPPKPFSTDDVMPKRDIEGWHAVEEDIDDIDVGDMEDFEQVAEDAKKRRKEDTNMKNVEWKRCEHCNEMKEETHFRRYRNGEYGKVCNTCIGSKISAGHKKNAKAEEQTPDKGDRLRTLSSFLDEKKIVMPESTLPKLPYEHCDGADAIAYGLLHVKEKAPLLKDNKPLIAMSEKVFEEAILFAYAKGKEDAETPKVEEITSVHAESLAMRMILNLKTGE